VRLAEDEFRAMKTAVQRLFQRWLQSPGLPRIGRRANDRFVKHEAAVCHKVVINQPNALWWLRPHPPGVFGAMTRVHRCAVS
jgi:hypothetical protein